MLLSELHRLWSTVQAYREPFTKRWWTAQQHIVENPMLVLPEREWDALRGSWRFAAEYCNQGAK